MLRGAELCAPRATAPRGWPPGARSGRCANAGVAGWNQLFARAELPRRQTFRPAKCPMHVAGMPGQKMPDTGRGKR
jgi:hypothetical protein